jgi:hypothetical protein
MGWRTALAHFCAMITLFKRHRPMTALDKIIQAANAAILARGSGQLATKKYAKMIDTHWAAYMFASGNHDSVDLHLGLRAITSARPLEHFSHLGGCDWPVSARYIGLEHQPIVTNPPKMRH